MLMQNICVSDDVLGTNQRDQLLYLVVYFYPLNESQFPLLPILQISTTIPINNNNQA